jgi:excisionase family DNA binding protein
MDQKMVKVLRAAGDYYAENHDSEGEKMISALNPYYRDDADDEPRRVSDFQKVYSVEFLLDLIKGSSGEPAAQMIREAIHFRYEIHEASGTFHIWELDEEKWLLYADLVVIRTLENLNGQGAMTPAEIAATWNVKEDTVRDACQHGWIPARKSGATWLIRRADAEARWGGK